MTLGSRLAFAAWRLYRTNTLARSVLTPRLRRSAEKGLARHEAFEDACAPSEAWGAPRPSADPVLDVHVDSASSELAARLFGLLNHWGARYRVVASGGEGIGPRRGAFVGIARAGERSDPLAPGTVSLVPYLPRGARSEGEPIWTAVSHAARVGEAPYVARVYGERPPVDAQAMVAPPGSSWRRNDGRVERYDRPTVAFDERILTPRFTASAWGCVLGDAIDWVVGRKDWRAPLPALVSARVDDVTGAGGLGWLGALEDHGIRPSVGTLHDEWLASGEAAVRGVVAASTRGASVSPHAFSMERFIWYDAPRGCPFSLAAMQAHRAKLEADARATGLRFGRTLNAHFDCVGTSALEAARALGFRYVLGEHALDQDWRSGPRRRDPLGTPLFATGWLDAGRTFLGYQAAGAIASSAAPLSRYDWLRNFLELDPATGRPIAASLDRAGAVRQGVTQLLSGLHAGLGGYLVAHEMHLDALGREVVGALVADVLREVKARVPGAAPAPFDELPAALEARARAADPT